jgi:predicted nucleic acid-binding protein
VLIDTSGLLSYLHRDEATHLDAVSLFHGAPRRVIHSYVMAEFVALATARGLPRQRTLAFVADLMDSAAIDLVWVGEPVHRAASHCCAAGWTKPTRCVTRSASSSCGTAASRMP